MKSIFLLLIMILSSNAFAQAQTNTEVVTTNAPLISEVMSLEQNFKITLTIQDKQLIPLNKYHNWIVTIINNVDDSPVYPAHITVGGGMPAHGHGLPTQPEISQYLGNGQYLLEGMKFNMDGRWLIKMHITTPTLQDTAEIYVEVNY